MKLKKLALLSLTLTSFLSTGLFADDIDSSFILKRIQERGVINMGHRESSVPFSFLNKEGKPEGYSIDLCNKIIDKIKEVTGKKDLKINYVPVTSQTRIALMANGTIDIECGSTTNNLTRQKQVDYLPITFITGAKLVSKKGSGITKIEDLDGKVMGLPLGSNTEKIIRGIAKKKGLKMKYVMTKDHPQAWLTLESGRIDAYAADGVLLYGLISKAKKPDEFQVTGKFLSYDPYGIMVPHDDSTYRRLGTVVLADLMRSGEILKIYDKWFNPGPTGINMPISDKLKMAFEIQALPY